MVQMLKISVDFEIQKLIFLGLNEVQNSTFFISLGNVETVHLMQFYDLPEHIIVDERFLINVEFVVLEQARNRRVVPFYLSQEFTQFCLTLSHPPASNYM